MLNWIRGPNSGVGIGPFFNDRGRWFFFIFKKYGQSGQAQGGTM